MQRLWRLGTLPIQRQQRMLILSSERSVSITKGKCSAELLNMQFSGHVSWFHVPLTLIEPIRLSLQYHRFVLVQWLIKHPQFLGNQLYIGGDSYSGIIVPLLVTNILEGIYIQNQILIFNSALVRSILLWRNEINVQVWKLD